MNFYKNPITGNVTQALVQPVGFTNQRFIRNGEPISQELALEQEAFELANNLELTVFSITDTYDWVKITKGEYINTLRKLAPVETSKPEKALK